MSKPLQLLMGAAALTVAAVVGYYFYSANRVALLSADTERCRKSEIRLAEFIEGRGETKFGRYSKAGQIFEVQQCHRRGFNLSLFTAHQIFKVLPSDK